MLKRLAFGVGANAFDKVVIAGSQMLIVPVQAVHWGLETYAVWVLLSTVPAFLAIGDFGFAIAAGTKMTMAVARGSRAEAVRTFQSAWVVTLISSIGLLSAGVALAWYTPDHIYGHTSTFSADEVRTTFAILICYGIVTLQGGIFLAAFQCAGLYAIAAFCHGLIALFEGVAVIAIVWAGGTPLAAAVTLLACRGLGLAAQYALLRRVVPWLSAGIKHANFGEIKTLAKPGGAAMVLPISHAFLLQGTAVALSLGASQAAVPAFTTTRTLSRVGLQIPLLLNRAILPEFSAASVRHDRQALAVMLLGTIAASAILVVPFAAFLAIFGADVVAVWTRGVVRPQQDLLLVMAASFVLAGLWNPISNLMLATNRHASYTFPFVALAVASMPLAYFLSKQFGAVGAGATLLVVDASMTVLVARLARTLGVATSDLSSASQLLRERGRSLLPKKR